MLRKIFCNDKTAFDTPKLSKIYNLWTIIFTIILVAKAINYIRIFQFGNVAEWSISEFFINFEGGFTRRGLLGQIMFWFCDATGIDPRWFILAFCGACFFAAVILFIRRIRDYKIWWWIMPLCLGFGGLGGNFIRKDYAILLLAIACFALYNSPRIRSTFKLVYITLISLLALSLHETSFFLYMPFLWLMIFIDDTIKLPNIYKILSALLIIGYMAVILLSTGNPSTPELIKASWHSLFPELITVDGDLLTVDSMRWSVKDALEFNESIPMQFFTAPIGKALTDMVYLSALIVFGIIIMIRYPFVARRSKESLFPCKQSTFSAVIICSFISMLPLFLGLSCDFGRLLSQIFLVSFFIASMFPEHRIANALFIDSLHFPINVSIFATRVIPGIAILMLLMLIYYAPFSRLDFDPFHTIRISVQFIVQYVSLLFA